MKEKFTYDELEKINDEIYKVYNEHKRNWEATKKIHPLESVAKAQIEKISFSLGDKSFTLEDWIEIATDCQNKLKKKDTTRIGSRVKNDTKIPESGTSSWIAYVKKLKEKGLSTSSIEYITDSTFEILQNLNLDIKNQSPAVKGLVIGNVQSGKTANMAGLMAMAADNGFNFFIILSGLVENLRKQTLNRLYFDLKGETRTTLNWNKIENPSIRSNNVEEKISHFNLGDNSKEIYFTVCLKNKTRLTNLKNWLVSDENKAKQIRMLIIDDEADQASINTKNIEEDTSTINQIIKDLVNDNKIGAVNYIAYTATPYANVLNEVGQESLYPKDFIVSLENSDDYIGPKEIFGIEEPETGSKLEITEQISDSDALWVRELQEDGSRQGLPPSFKKSINWFIISLAALRYLGYKKPVSMLVHTSLKISEHHTIAIEIEKYLINNSHNLKNYILELEKEYEMGQRDLTRDHFISVMENYSTPNEVPDYPKFNDIKKEIEYLFIKNKENLISHLPLDKEGKPKFHNGIHLAIDNSRKNETDKHVRLLYPDQIQASNKAKAFIVVGGNTLSRGLTIEGLVSTYFLRTTKQADTLLQMGRWFGYRKGYELFPRIWLENIAYDRYQFIAQLNEELREEIKNYAKHGKLPSEVGPRIKHSYNTNLLRITASNKSQSAVTADVDFTGFDSQTIYFENNYSKLTKNIEVTKKFLNNLDDPEENQSTIVWRNVSHDIIREYFDEYYITNNDIKMSNLPKLMEWIEKNQDIDNWNVVYSHKGIYESSDSNWLINGKGYKSNIRTKRIANSNNVVSGIGVLRTPSDLLADINDITLKRSISKKSELINARENAGLGRTPQLLIYKLDKDNRSIEEYRKSSDSINKREPLNFSQDIIGLSVLIPGEQRGNNSITYVTANIPTIDEDLEIEEE